MSLKSAQTHLERVVRLRLIQFSLDRTDPDHLAGVPCPVCRQAVVVHLPDIAAPHRLLATCNQCKSWFLMDDASETMIQLPTSDQLREQAVESR